MSEQVPHQYTLADLIPGKNCNMLVVVPEGRWVYNGEDITDNAPMLRKAFKEFVVTNESTRRGKSATLFVFNDQQAVANAKISLDKFKAIVDPDLNKPVKLWDVKLQSSPPKDL